jgi:hypothetical protein
MIPPTIVVIQDFHKNVTISFHIRATTTGIQAVSHQGSLDKENITTPMKAGSARTLPIKTQVCSLNQLMFHLLPILSLTN